MIHKNIRPAAEEGKAGRVDDGAVQQRQMQHQQSASCAPRPARPAVRDSSSKPASLSWRAGGGGGGGVRVCACVRVGG